MCGIAGIYHFHAGQPVDFRALKAMTASLAHRGPDGSGIHVDGRGGVGHRRLSIIDLSPAGAQPMPNEDESVWIVYNGESYNFREHIEPLKARGHVFRSCSDTEVILHLYEEYGPACLEKITGMFAFAIWDSRDGSFFIARDRLGIKPLYYYNDGKTFLFASELKALIHHPAFKREPDLKALGSFFRFMSIPDPQCIFKNTAKLLPGHYLRIRDDRVDLHRYWDIESFGTGGDAGTGNGFSERFEQAVTSHLVSDVELGLFLSGGADSSAVACMASRKKSLRSYSIAFSGMEGYDESPYAAMAAESCNTRHRNHELTPAFVEDFSSMVWHGDEPFAVSSAFALYALSREVSRQVKVVLTGDGADEIFAGYPWRHTAYGAAGWDGASPLFTTLDRSGFNRLPPDSFYQRLKRMVCPSFRYSAAFSAFHPGSLAGLLADDCRDDVLKAWDDDVVARWYRLPVQANSLSRKLYAEMKTTLVSEMLTKVDRMTMAFGLEARVPFLDHALVEWAFTVPPHEKTDGVQGKLLLKRSMERSLPREILYRPKHGFNVPMAEWLRGGLGGWARDIIGSTSFRERGYFVPEAVEGLLKVHEQGIGDESGRLLTILAFEQWCRLYLDQTHSNG